jgi:hypothetical protein
MTENQEQAALMEWARLSEWSDVSVYTIKGWLYNNRIARKNSPNLKRVADVLRVGVEELRGAGMKVELYHVEGEGK